MSALRQTGQGSGDVCCHLGLCSCSVWTAWSPRDEDRRTNAGKGCHLNARVLNLGEGLVRAVRAQTHFEDVGARSRSKVTDGGKEGEKQVSETCSKRLSGQMVVKKFPLRFSLIFVKTKSLFSLADEAD